MIHLILNILSTISLLFIVYGVMQNTKRVQQCEKMIISLSSIIDETDPLLETVLLILLKDSVDKEDYDKAQKIKDILELRLKNPKLNKC